DFEPVTAWACRLRGIPCVGLSHQSAFLSPKTPRPSRFLPHWAELLFRYYAPVTHAVSFHFKPYDEFIHPPVIRREIRELTPTNEGHYTVYLPAHDDRLLVGLLRKVSDVKWEIFSKHSRKAYSAGNIVVRP